MEIWKALFETNFGVDVMRYLFFLLILATFPLGDGPSASPFSAEEINSVKAQACARLATLTFEQTIQTPRGPRFEFNTGDSQVEVVLHPSFPKWRAAIVNISDRSGLPTVEIRLAKNCKIILSRQITRRRDNKMLSITDLGPDFLPSGNAEIQDPPHHFTIKPVDRSSGTPRIAVVHTGVNCTLPEFQKHIAVDADEHLIGYDFCDHDHWPYDSDPRRSAFFPLHHGSTIFSVLGREASLSTIAIYRIPAEQMCQLSDLVQHIAKTPVRGGQYVDGIE